MKNAAYKLAGDIPAALKGTDKIVQKDGADVTVKEPFTINTREAETLDEFANLVEDGDMKHVLRLAQGQYDIIAQRKVREYLQSDEVAGILAGNKVGEGDAETDFSVFDESERVQEVLARAQVIADEYVYGSRTTTPGGGAKAAVERDKKVRAAASADPELAAKLAALGITL